MNNFNLPKIQALVAPLTAPVPSALGVAAEAYTYMAGQSTEFWGWVAAVGAFAGIETMGGASCYALVKLHRERNYGVEFAIALLGIAAYVGSGWYTLADSPMIIFFFLAPFSYFAYSILRSMDREIEDKVTETEAQIRLINAQKALVNAETRKARSVQAVQLDMVDTVQIDRTCREDVQALLDAEPDLPAREIARRLGISPTTASEHKKLYEGAKR